MKTWIIVSIVLIPISLYIIIRTIKIKQKNKVTKNDPKVCDLYYFYTSWCPYCKKAFVEWNKFKSEWNYKKMDGYDIHFHEVDCDVSEALATKYNVTIYPTIKLIKDDTIINYDAKPTVHSLTKFLISSFE